MYYIVHMKVEMSTDGRMILGYTDHSVSLRKTLDSLQSQGILIGFLQRSPLIQPRSIIFSIVKFVIVVVIVTELCFVDIRV